MQQVVIGSWTPGKHFRTGVIGALLLGISGPVASSMSGKWVLAHRGDAAVDLGSVVAWVSGSA